MYLHTAAIELTFADLHAFKPAVIDVSVADIPTVLVPSTARSAATDSAGFLERAAPWARRGDGWRVYRRGDWRVDCY